VKEIQIMEHTVTAKDLSQYLKTSGSTIIRTLVETSPDAVALIDLNTNILMINQQGMALAGYKNNNAGDIIGRTILEFIAPKDRSQVAENVLKPVETGSIRNFQCNALKKDGTQCPVELSASLIVDKGGKPRALMAVLRDITERKHAEEMLRNSEISYRRLFEGREVSMCGSKARIGGETFGKPYTYCR
jgi:PAS domain S-box-containing protein